MNSLLVTPVSGASEPPLLELSGLLGVLGFAGEELVSVLNERNGDVSTVVLPLADVFAHVDSIPDDHNVYFGINPMCATVRERFGKRGTDEDVTRLATLPIDFDFAANKCPNPDTAETIVAELSGILGVRPVARTDSGHGLHVYFAIDPDDGRGGDTATRRAILKRFGRLVCAVAKAHGAKVDSVFDLARMLRLPGSNNCKISGEPVHVRTYGDTGAPLSLSELDDRLTEYGIYEQDDDGAESRIISEPSDWEFADETCNYVHPIVHELPTDRPSETKPGRHPWALKQAVRLACAVRQGCITESDWCAAQERMHSRLVQLRKETGEKVPAYEVPSMFEWAIGKAAEKTDAEVAEELGGHKHPKPIDEDFFWESCDELRNLRQFARARRVGPWAMFGAVCAIVTAAVPPHVVLPPLVGSYATLNTFVALVGPSGAIKSAAIRAAYDWLRLDPEPNVKKPGSGEGLAKCFAYKGKVDNEIQQVGKAWSVVAEITEVDSLIATGGRGGSTLMSELRSAWSGERLGFDYAGQDKAITLEGHRYRLTMLVGVQPKRSGPLFEDADGGTPQRFIWLPTTDPNPPNLRPQEPAPLTLDLPGRFDPRAGDGKLVPDRNMRRRAELDTPADRTAFRVIGVPKAVEDAVESRTLAALTGTENGDALDGHKLLCREKLAAFIAILRGHNDAITEQDWELSEVVMAVSDRTRQETQKVLSVEAERRNKSAGKSQGHRKIAEANVIADAQVQRIKDVGEKVCAKLAAADGKSMSGADLKRKIRGLRENFDDVLGYLEDEGRAVVETVQYQGQPGIRVTLLDGPEQTI